MSVIDKKSVAVHVCPRAGLTPRHFESDTTVHRGSVTKQGPSLLRWAAIEATSNGRGGPKLG